MSNANMSSVQISKRLIYIVAFLFILIPILVGVIVWHATQSAHRRNDDGDDKAMSVGNASSFIAADADGGVMVKGTSNDTSTVTVVPLVDTTPSAADIAAKPWLALRLPKYQVPVHYDITLFPDIYDGNETFYGSETIEVEIRNNTKFLLVHVLKLQVKVVGLKVKDTEKELKIARTFEESKHQLLVVEAAQVVPANTVLLLSLEFNGSLTEATVGLYKNSYVNSITGETRYLASSKFEPVSARRAFPCMDEPNLKAEYTVSLVHRPDYTALSNMPPVGDSEPWPSNKGLVVTRFQRSVKMSTYLVCFIVCDFDFVEDKTASGTRVRVYATPDKMNQTQYALQVAIHTLTDYEYLFNISYPLPKQDMIAIPDFVAGAMEHWGLISYRESNLLFDPNKASAANKQRVAVVVAHEMAHQWFGNLVTMDWWNDLWLNEGFASFMEYIGTETIEPRWQMLSQFLIEDAQPVMEIDARVTSHPIVVDVTSPDEINEVFDKISYSKGASVIRMLESIMGKANFFKGVSNYLTRYQWGNAQTHDLWETLAEVEHAPDVTFIMDTWTRQSGFPYINLTFSGQGQSTKVDAVQSRFLAVPGAEFNVSDSPFGYKWYVSLDCATSAGHKVVNVMNMTNASFEVGVNTEDGSSWVKCNKNQAGFYRVNYPPSNWRQLSTMLRTTPVKNWALTPADRSGLLNDALSLAGAGLLGYDVALEMTSYLHREESFIPWQSTYASLTYISSMMTFDVNFGLWKDFVLSIAVPALQRLGYADSGSHLHKRLRGMMIDMACRHGDPGCLSFAASSFRKWIEDGTAPSVNARSMVYKWGMWGSGTAEDWEETWTRYKAEIVPQEKVNMLRALCMTQTPWLISRLLAYTLEGSHIKQSDFILVIMMVSHNPSARHILWNWVQQHWQDFVDKFTLFDRNLGRVVPSVAEAFNTGFDKEQVLEFFAKFPEAGAGARGRAQALETIDQNIYWTDHFKPTVVEWLKKRQQPSS